LIARQRLAIREASCENGRDNEQKCNRSQVPA
jgi:hypothetical protein